MAEGTVMQAILQQIKALRPTSSVGYEHMFRRASNLIAAVADVLDDMLAADFEFEVDDASATAGTRLEAAGIAPATCAAEGRHRRSPEPPSASPRREGSVPRPDEFCLTPVSARSHRDDGGSHRLS